MEDLINELRNIASSEILAAETKVHLMLMALQEYEDANG